MKPCHGCGEATVDPEAPPRYDVFNPACIPGESNPADFGPYGPECWPSTMTGSRVEESAPTEGDPT